MESFKGLPIFWADKPLPGLIVVNSPRQVTHQLPRFGFGFQGKIPTGQDPVRSKSSRLPDREVGSFHLTVWVKPPPQTLDYGKMSK